MFVGALTFKGYSKAKTRGGQSIVFDLINFYPEEGTWPKSVAMQAAQYVHVRNYR